MNALQSILVTASSDLREALLRDRGRELIRRCSQLRPETWTVSTARSATRPQPSMPLPAPTDEDRL